jgi:hypothetical protein
MNENLGNYGLRDGKRERIEDWFDKHPIPWDIIMYTYEFGSYKIEIFTADSFRDDYLIKIICNNARRSISLSAELKPLCDSAGIERVIINRKLFLFRRSFFEV